MHPVTRGASPSSRWGLLLLLAAACAPARAQLLKMGPIDLGLNLNSSLIYTDNANGLADGEDPPDGEARDDAYMTYGFTLSGRTKVYPNIDLNLSASLNKEIHFIQDEDVADSFPFLGSSSFNLARSRGRYNFNLGLLYNADSEYDKEVVFRPSGRRKARDITQTMSANLGLGWAFSRLRYNATYSYVRERHSEDFADGDNNSQTLGFTGQYDITDRVHARATVNRNKQDQLNVENDPASGIWEQTIFLGFDFDIMKKPSLRYTVGGEREDELGVTGDWEPQHTVTFNDNRQLAPTLNSSVNASYTFERQEETDDIAFTYGASLNHQLPYRFQQGLSATREPVGTFGTTQTTDSTSLTYNLNHPSFFIRLLNMAFSVAYSHDVPKGPVPGPVEDTMSYTFSLSRSFQLSRKWSSSLSYIYNLEDREIQAEPVQNESVAEQRVSLTFTYTVF